MEIRDDEKPTDADSAYRMLLGDAQSAINRVRENIINGNYSEYEDDDSDDDLDIDDDEDWDDVDEIDVDDDEDWDDDWDA